MSLLRCEHMLNRHLNTNLARHLQPGGFPARVCLQEICSFIEESELFDSLSSLCPTCACWIKPGN